MDSATPPLQHYSFVSSVHKHQQDIYIRDGSYLMDLTFIGVWYLILDWIQLKPSQTSAIEALACAELLLQAPHAQQDLIMFKPKRIWAKRLLKSHVLHKWIALRFWCTMDVWPLIWGSTSQTAWPQCLASHTASEKTNGWSNKPWKGLKRM